MNEQDYTYIEDYLSGHLDETEIILFEERLKTDKAFKDAFHVYKDLSAHLEYEIGYEQQRLDFKANLEHISQGYFDTLKTEQPKQKSKFFRWSQLAVAASVTLLVSIFAYNTLRQPSYSDYNSFEPISITVRSTEDELTTKAENAFNAKDFKTAEVLLGQLLKQDPENLELQLYRGVTLIETDQFQAADRLLMKLSETNSAFKNKVKWYWALSQLKQENYENCMSILKTISEDSEDYEQAQKLLKKLD